MKPRLVTIACTLTILGGCCEPVSGTETAPVTRPVPTTKCAESTDAGVLKILKDQEAAAEKYATIKADLTMEVLDRRVGDREERSGWIAYQKRTRDNPTKFRIHFNTRKLGKGPTTRAKLDYAFDGSWLSIARHEIKQIQRFQVVPKGEKTEPMRLGKGPFPLPFGQTAREVLKYYEASTRPLKPGEPEETTYLKLTVRKEHYKDLDAIRLEVWIDPKTQLPVKLISRDKQKKVTTATFGNIKTNVKIDGKKVFEIPRPPGWTEERKPLRK